MEQVVLDLIKLYKTQVRKGFEVKERIAFPNAVAEAMYSKTLQNAELSFLLLEQIIQHNPEATQIISDVLIKERT